MRNLWGLAIAVFAGCLVKPQPSSVTTDAPCAILGPWGSPVQLTGTFDTPAGARSPWLSANGNELWFARRQSPTDIDIFRAVRVNNTWGPAEPAVNVDDPNLQDNPFVSDDGMTMFYDAGTSTTEQIQEAQRPADGVTFGAPRLHSELSHGRIEPALSRDQLTLYFSNGSSIYRATRTEPMTDFQPPQQLDSGGISIESPSIASDDTTLYVTGHIGGGTLIYTGTITGAAITGLQTLPFETSGLYFDATVSRDGRTLVFAHTDDSTVPAHLWYVTRDCITQ
ncbi:MAG: hypothetical protein JWO36_5123 [Myxococcales bacterium]|nr:hypothetical protein [Myxococcales bacterium]